MPNGAENVFLSIVQAVMEVLNKSHFSLQMGNFPIPVAEHSVLSVVRIDFHISESSTIWFDNHRESQSELRVHLLSSTSLKRD